MTTYYIDFNRGNDANLGTSIAQAWQNPSKLATLGITTNDSVFFARDSIWNLSAGVGLASMVAASGTLGNPVYFGAYDTVLETTAKPQLNWNVSIAPGDWTYDGARNGWYCTPVAGWPASSMSRLAVGNTIAYRQSTDWPLSSAYLSWKEDVNNVYLQAPAGVDPTTLYGSVVYGPEKGALYFANKGRHVLIENLSAVNASAPVGFYNNTLDHDWTLRNIDVDGCAPLYLINTLSGTGSTRIVVDSFNAINSPSASIHPLHGGSGSNYYRNLTIRNSRFVNGNKYNPQGAIYSAAKNVIVEDCYFSDMYYASPGSAVDGSGLYQDLGGDGIIGRRNTFERCTIAMQQGNTASATFIDNLILDCTCGMRVSNSGTGSLADQSHVFVGNTIVNAGVDAPRYGSGFPSGAWWAYDNNGTSPNMTVDVRNNLMTGNGLVPAFAEPSVGFKSAVIDNNVAYNFSALTGTSYAPATPGTVAPTNTITTDPLIDSSGNITSHASPAYHTGLEIAGHIYDSVRIPRWIPPSIGGKEFIEPRPARSSFT